MNTEAFEKWAKADYAEIDLDRLPSGNYRNSATRDKHAAYTAGHADGILSAIQKLIEGQEQK